MIRLPISIYFLVSIFSASILSVANSQEPSVAVLTPQAWKDHQVLEAQNQVLRISSRIASLKNTKPAIKSKEDLNLNIGRVKKVENDPVAAGERDLRRAQDSLQAASNYGLEEYIAIYLPTIADQADAISTLTNRLSKEELAEILKGLLKKDSPSDAKRNGNLTADALSFGARSR